MVESNKANKPVVVAFVADLMAATRIRSVVQGQDRELIVIDDGFDENQADLNPLEGEPIQGPDAALFDKLTKWSPILIIFDIGDAGMPWRRWLMRLKSSPASRRLPVICFGPHIQTDMLSEAEELAADLVVSRSRFFTDMPQLLDDYARDDNAIIIEESCSEPLPELARIGIEAFNSGEYFEAHEHLEDVWKADQSPGRNFYRVLIQIAVAYLQIERSNYRGAYKMLLRSRQWFHGLPEVCRGVDVRSLRDDSEAVYRELMRSGPEGIADFDHSFLNPVRYIESE
jgi:hypothetical protein